ncbi:hypothetical protein GGER_01750 [Serratia rubidaea]
MLKLPNGEGIPCIHRNYIIPGADAPKPTDAIHIILGGQRVEAQKRRGTQAMLVSDHKEI